MYFDMPMSIKGYTYCLSVGCLTIRGLLIDSCARVIGIGTATGLGLNQCAATAC